MSFVHLRLHSEYSIVDGTVRLDALAQAAVSDRQPAVALTDLSNLFGALKFYIAMRTVGVKPIIGAEVWLRRREAPAGRLLLLVLNQRGYHNLCELLTRANLENRDRNGDAWVEWDWLTQGLHEGLIALSGGHFGLVGAALQQDKLPLAEQLAREQAALFEGRYYLELMRLGRGESTHVSQLTLELAERLLLPVVATHPVQFLRAGDYEAHTARVCIARGRTLSHPQTEREFSEDQYFKSTAEMQQAFADVPSALANTLEIAARCSLSIELGVPKLPAFHLEDGTVLAGDALKQHFAEASRTGLARRLEQLGITDLDTRQRYVERLEFEIATILEMDFAGYFLIVAEFIEWARQHDCPVGPGRGSGAGSVVAYSLRITDIDPLRYGLLFERFLNPKRKTMPDFDVDFCQLNRDRVIEHVREKYGAQAVSQIVTFGTMAARAAVRDVGRVMELGYNFCDGIAKLIPNKPGKPVTIAQALQSEALLRERYEQEPEVKQLLDLAQEVEGLTRNVGMHAGGVLIAPSKLIDFCPLYAQPDSSDAVSQFDKDDVEAAGLVKFDFLGLTTLTILEQTLAFIHARHPEQRGLRLEDIPLNDPVVYQQIGQAHTTAVFQLESNGFQNLLKKAQPQTFEEIIALVALFRPGPMDLIPSFVERRHGREPVQYPHPSLEGILRETFGIMVYQEQVMQAAQIIAGFSLGEADNLRRAMGKKKVEEMAKQRAVFILGAQSNENINISEQQAAEVFDLMEKFAGYGFNKSHAAAYALLSVQTAWMKAHYAPEFMAANMNLALDDTDRLRQLCLELPRLNLELLPPDINKSGALFQPVGVRQVRFALGAVKGVGVAAMREVEREVREHGAFTSVLDFLHRVDRSKINKRALEALVRAGAFDVLQPNRARLLASVEVLVDQVEQAQANALQGNLFGESEPGPLVETLLEAPPWSPAQKLREEKLALGFYLSGNLFDVYAEELRPLISSRLEELQDSREPQRIAGIVTSIRQIKGARGRMTILQLDDGTATLEVTAFDKEFERLRGKLVEDTAVLLRISTSLRQTEEGFRVVLQEAWSMEEVRRDYAKAIRVSFTESEHVSAPPPLDAFLLGLLQAQAAEGKPVWVELRTSLGQGEVQLPQHKLLLTDAALDSLRHLPGAPKVRVVY